MKCLKDLDIAVVGNGRATTEVPAEEDYNPAYDPDYWEQDETGEELDDADL